MLPGRHSKRLLRSSQIVENPTLVHQGSHYVLFTSEGWYGGCDYRTTYRKSRKRWSWPTRSTNFLGPVVTGLCGPGGADVVAPSRGARARLFFHGWTCYQTHQPCPRTFRRDRDAALAALARDVRRAARLGRLGQPGGRGLPDAALTAAVRRDQRDGNQAPGHEHDELDDQHASLPLFRPRST